jgi:hypothetical protein
VDLSPVHQLIPGNARQRSVKRVSHGDDVRSMLPQLQSLLSSAEWLADVSTQTTTEMLRLLGWPGTIVRSTDLPARSGRSERLAHLASAVGAATYLCGTGGSRYLDPLPFRTRGLHVAMFQPPQHLAGVACQEPRRLTALTDLAAVGRAALAEQVRKHALEWRANPEESPQDRIASG